MSIINIYKPIGLSPLQAMNILKEQNPSLQDSVMVYAGRLDPMADGVLLVLSDEDRFQKDKYLNLGKTYKATVLFGFKSDSLDALGMVEKTNASPLYKGGMRGVVEAVEGLVGTHSLPFPNYSSYKVQGKPLHWWTKNNKLNEIEIPLKEMNVLNVESIELNTIDSEQVLENIVSRIEKVNGDFRQDKIVSNWKEVLSDKQELLVVTFSINVSSGTYIRSLADKLGKDLGVGALLLNLTRTRVGIFDILDARKIL